MAPKFCFKVQEKVRKSLWFSKGLNWIFQQKELGSQSDHYSVPNTMVLFIENNNRKIVDLHLQGRNLFDSGKVIHTHFFYHLNSPAFNKITLSIHPGSLTWNLRLQFWAKGKSSSKPSFSEILCYVHFFLDVTWCNPKNISPVTITSAKTGPRLSALKIGGNHPTFRFIRPFWIPRSVFDVCWGVWIRRIMCRKRRPGMGIWKRDLEFVGVKLKKGLWKNLGCQMLLVILRDLAQRSALKQKT